MSLKESFSTHPIGFIQANDFSNPPEKLEAKSVWSIKKEKTESKLFQENFKTTWKSKVLVITLNQDSNNKSAESV